MQILALKKAVPLLLLFALSLILIATATPKATAAVQRSECNGQYISNSEKCKSDFDECEDGPNQDRCRQNAINRYKIEQAGQSGKYQCGNLANEADNVKTKFNFGCLGKRGPSGLGPIQDLVFALIRFASVGVGIAVVISIILAGLQYSTAEGNPETTQKAKTRITYSMIALLVYVFTFSILQFLIPGGLFKP